MPIRASVGTVCLIPFDESGTRELYSIRNHPSVRRFMSHPELIPYQTHRAWVRNHLLTGTDLHLWLVRPTADARAVGFTQLQIDEQKSVASIGVMFREPEKHRYPAAIASAVTIHIAFERLGCDMMRSFVLPQHAAAIEFNQAWGGRIVESDRPGMVMLVMSREEALANPTYRKLMSRIGGTLQISTT